MHTSLQASLLEEFDKLTPDTNQLWIATHSIGMLKKAEELYQANSEEVVFLDFSNHNFDEEVIITPTKPNRNFWKESLKVAIGDLATLIAPKSIIFCEGGRTELGAKKNKQFDAKCFNAIFAEEFPSVEFISVGGANDVEKNALLIQSCDC